MTPIYFPMKNIYRERFWYHSVIVNSTCVVQTNIGLGDTPTSWGWVNLENLIIIPNYRTRTAAYLLLQQISFFPKPFRIEISLADSKIQNQDCSIFILIDHFLHITIQNRNFFSFFPPSRWNRYSFFNWSYLKRNVSNSHWRVVYDRFWHKILWVFTLKMS